MVVSGTDLASTLSFLLLGLVVLAVVVSIVIGIGKRRGSKTLSLDVALTLSGWWLMASAAGAVLAVVKASTGGLLELDAAALTLPWPDGVPCASGGPTGETSDAAMVWCSTMHPNLLSVQNVSVGIVVLGVVAQVAQLALWAVPAAMLAVTCFSTLRGRAFGRTVTRSLVGGAIAFAVLGIVTEASSGVAATLALREVFAESSPAYPQTFQLGFSPLPLLAAVGLFALAAVFRVGMRMQLEKEQLQKETEGLV